MNFEAFSWIVIRNRRNDALETVLVQCNLIFETVPPFQLPKTSLVSCTWSIVTNKILGMYRYITEGVYAKALYVPYLCSSGWILVEVCDEILPVSICIHCVFFLWLHLLPRGLPWQQFLVYCGQFSQLGYHFLGHRSDGLRYSRLCFVETGLVCPCLYFK